LELTMRIRLTSVALVCAAIVTVRIGADSAAAPSVAAAQSASTLDDQIDVSVTVYNSDLALVRDVRNVQLPEGRFDLSFMDIAATVNPATVHVRSLTQPGRLSVLEQNYEYDLLDPDKLLHKYVGRDVTLVRMRGGNVGEPEEVTAHLVSFNGAPVWRIGKEIVTGLNADHMRFPELPGNLYTHPTLIWTLQNTGAARHHVETSYLAGKLAWNADYVLTVRRDDAAADLDGWVTLRNESGTAFRNVRLQLVAGDVNRVRQVVDDLQMKLRAETAPPSSRMSQESFSDYHLYTLDRRTTINNAETKQVSMLSGSGVPVKKRYVVEGQAFYYRNGRHPGAPIKDEVQVIYQFRNEQKSGLGMPMPAGTVRVYQADSHGGVQFVGEDAIAHTPKDETLNLTIGHAFDVVCERKQVDFRQLSSTVFEFEYEITLRNHKSGPVVVEVNEPIGGTWQMLQSSHQWTKTDAWAAQFPVSVAADGSAVLRYRTRVTY
jgi:hypothetical protein